MYVKMQKKVRTTLGSLQIYRGPRGRQYFKVKGAFYPLVPKR